jgi:predicted ATPase
MSTHSPSPFPTADSASARWRVRLLGGFEIDNGQERLTRLRSRAATLLVARLALAPTRDHAREELCELLWPDVSLALSRSRLRQTLSMLRAVLEPPGSEPVLLVDKRVLRVMPGALWCDAVAFDRAVARGDSAVALGHYGGELLPGFYDEWVHDERLRLEGLRDRLASPASGDPKVAPAAPPAPAPIASSPKPAHRLPSYWTRAFGLQPSVDKLTALVAAERLVTVHGPGGSGKTRLAVATAQAFGDQLQADASQRFTRIEFVPLLACTTTVQALDAMGQLLRVEGTGDALKRLTAALDSGPTLLVLDNAEQLVADDLGSAVTHLLSALPELHVLVTSRRLLDVDGETSFALEGLPLPSAELNGGDNAALALFVARARAVRVDFHINAAHHAQAAAALVRLLSGMPLAIELAASRMRSLSAPELLERLQASAGSPMLNLLARGTQRATPDARHASMRHTIAWTWEQLTPAQQQLLRALAIPAMPVRLEAVAALAGTEVLAAQLQLDELVAASMVYAVEGADACRRFALLQPVREFATETSSDVEARLARARLRVWLLGFAQEAMARGPAVIAPDFPLVEMAITTAPEDDAAGQAIELVIAVRLHWGLSMITPRVTWAVVHFLPSATQPGARVQMEELLAYAYTMLGESDRALAHAEAAIALPCEPRLRSLALARWCWTHYGAGRFEVDFDTPLAEARTLAWHTGDMVAQIKVLEIESMIASNLRLQFSRCETLTAQRQQLCTQLGFATWASAALLTRAVMWAHTGKFEDAIAIASQCETVDREKGNQGGLCAATQQLARIYLMAKRPEDATAAFRRSIEVGWLNHLTMALARAMLHLPNALAVGVDASRAARLHGYGYAFYQRRYGSPNRIEARELCRTRRLLRIRLGVAQFEARIAEGAALTTAQAVALALAQNPAST